MGANKINQQPFIRSLIFTHPLQAAARVLEAGCIDKGNYFPSIYAYREAAAFPGLSGDGADAHTVILGQGREHRRFPLVGMADNGKFRNF